MTVSPSCRGRGAGAFLFREARARILAGHPDISAEVLVVRSSWTAARRVYRAEGFRETAELPSFFAPGEDGGGLVMERGRGA
jgi:ribosomal-protein-alanine N-acetyltransferase